MFLVVVVVMSSIGQDSERFRSEINTFQSLDSTANPDELVLFTGSSSIRFWPKLDSVFPGQNAINRGFGGSQMSDLLYYLEDIVFKHDPKKIFIYEGDNDLAAGKSVDEIMDDTQQVYDAIRSRLVHTRIYFISAKPSIARWDLKTDYLEFNETLKNWTANQNNTYFIDIWSPMCTSDGGLREDLFIADGLHMNKKGYDIWNKVIAPYVNLE